MQISSGEVVKAVVATVIAMGCSLLITLITSALVPVSMGVSDNVQIDKSKTYTRDELDHAEMAMKEKVRAESEKNKQAGWSAVSQVFQKSKKNSIWFVWIPFFILPLTVPAKIPVSIVPIVVLTAVAAFVGLFSLEEVLVFYIASICGFLLKYCGSTRNRGTPMRAANGDNS